MTTYMIGHLSASTDTRWLHECKS